MWQTLHFLWSLTNCRSKVSWDQSALLLETDDILRYWGYNMEASTVLCFKPLSQFSVWEWEKIAH